MPVRADDSQDTYQRSYDGVREFLRVFDQIRIRPTRRSGDLPVPVLSVTGPSSETVAVANALEDRCAGTPFADLAPSEEPTSATSQATPYSGLVARLREVSRELASAAPRGEAHLRFPLLAQVLWLLELDAADGDDVRLHDSVKRAVRRRRIRPGNEPDARNFWANVRAYAEGPLPAWAAATALISATLAEKLATWLGIATIAIGLVVGAAHVLLLSRSWAGRRRYKWFCRQPYLVPAKSRNPPKNFNEFAVRVIKARNLALSPHAAEAGAAKPSAPEAGQVTAGEEVDKRREQRRQAIEGIEHLLVNAFLHDLRQGYERSLWKFWRRVAWARTSLPVLLVRGGDTRLVTLIEEVRAGTGLLDPLMVVVTGSAARTELPPAGGTETLEGRPGFAEELWEQWQAELARDRVLGSRRLIRIVLKDGDTRLLGRSHVPVRTRRRPVLAHPLLPVLTVTALVAISLMRVGTTAASNCAPSIWWERGTGECVGFGYDYFGYTPRLEPVLTEIDKANKAILDSGRPYATVVYFGKLTNPRNGGDDPLTDIHGELAGIAVQQRLLTRNSSDGSKLRMRVLVANAGSDFRYAERVAEEVLRRVNEDPTIVGVVGLGESRQEVQNALRILGRKALPMVTTTSTFDDLGTREDGGDIPSYFPLAPPNSELAATAARWARSGLPSAGLAPSKKATVFADTSIRDLFGRDLGKRFEAAFGKDARRVEFEDAGELEQLVKSECSVESRRPDLAYYAGRSGQFGAFLTALSTSECDHVTVMASDDVTQYVNDNAPRIGRDIQRVVYVALASSSVWEFTAKHSPSFYGELRDLVKVLELPKEDPHNLPSDAYAVQAYDATEALMQAAQKAYSDQGGSASVAGEPGAVDRGGVLLALERLGPIYGASGVIRLRDAPDHRHALDRPIVLISIDANGQQTTIGRCGQLDREKEFPRCASSTP
ncbi:hypothetical protein GCM10009677_53990 [Sphaerisporangium rubeum]|uniref:ABC-type branched-subunit amino acid transport system substrate-binding protein n=1 Tax=Sphaerisporangium rubeum TaxID=321317 RepID=A0A7X0IJB0_9ACTN|nr:hypothetical protein [Sphaerisporangium rubeum]MBB6474747.1 ABC-type branched-subunit amino acid transport system substrate-binding protein [Sphaerisporangium rubeum]